MSNGQPRRSFRLAPLAGPALLLALAGCHLLDLTPTSKDRPDRPDKEGVLARPGKHHLRIAPYVFYADFELKRDLPLFRELATLRDQVCKELQLPDSSAVVEVYVFETRERYERFMAAKYAGLPARRAFFVAQPRGPGLPEDLLVYTFWGDRLREDLRHELTHALLHSVLKDVPLWLDEGLAEYFELPPGQRGISHHHLNLLRRGEPFRPDLARLEQLKKVEEMTPAEYREAWAWVHLMLGGDRETKVVLLNYLHALRSNPTPGPLRPRLADALASPEDALEKHLARLDRKESNHRDTEAQRR